MGNFVVTRKTVNELENFSVKIEHLKTMITIANQHVWQDIMEAENDDKLQIAIFQVGTLLETILEVIENRNTDIDRIIDDITDLKLTEGKSSGE